MSLKNFLRLHLQRKIKQSPKISIKALCAPPQSLSLPPSLSLKYSKGYLGGPNLVITSTHFVFYILREKSVCNRFTLISSCSQKHG